MRINSLILVSVFLAVAAKADDAEWFVSVYGEHMQLISGASATATVADGSYLGADFKGNTIYVRVQAGYELDGFRPYESVPHANTSSTVSESMDSAAAAAAPEEQSLDEFGPLADTGLQYFEDGNFFGWVCSQLYVKPMGDRVYRLRCDDEMVHTN